MAGWSAQDGEGGKNGGDQERGAEGQAERVPVAEAHWLGGLVGAVA